MEAEGLDGQMRKLYASSLDASHRMFDEYERHLSDLCGVGHPSDGRPCVRESQHPGRFHEDRNGRTWLG